MIRLTSSSPGTGAVKKIGFDERLDLPSHRWRFSALGRGESKHGFNPLAPFGRGSPKGGGGGRLNFFTPSG
jgi:hypothetical protein